MFGKTLVLNVFFYFKQDTSMIQLLGYLCDLVNVDVWAAVGTEQVSGQTDVKMTAVSQTM